MKYNEAVGLVVLSGIPHNGITKIPNGYLPDVPTYAEARKNSPWWQVFTPYGNLIIGHRKRVISIGWADTNRRGSVTEDDVTKGEDYVHAWSLGDAVKYLQAWNQLPAVAGIVRGSKNYDITGKVDCLSALRHCFEESDEVKMLEGLINLAPEGTLIDMCLTSLDGYYTAHLKIGGLSVKLYPKTIGSTEGVSDV